MAARYPNDGPPESGPEMLPRGWTMRRDNHGIVYENRTTGDWTRNKNEMWRRSGAMPQQHMARPQQQLPGMPDSSQMPASTPQRSRMPYTQQIATSSQHQIAPPQNNFVAPDDQHPLYQRSPDMCGGTDLEPYRLNYTESDSLMWRYNDNRPDSQPRDNPEPDFRDAIVLNRRENQLSQIQGQMDPHNSRRFVWPEPEYRAIDVQGHGFCAFHAIFGSLYLLGRSGGFENGWSIHRGLIKYMTDPNAERYLKDLAPPPPNRRSNPYQIWVNDAANGRGVGPEMFDVLAEWLEVQTILHLANYNPDTKRYEVGASQKYVPRTGRHTCTIHIGYSGGKDSRGQFRGHYFILIPIGNHQPAARLDGGMRSSSPRPAQSSTSTHSQGSVVSQESLDNLTSMGFPKNLSATALQKAGGNEQRAIDYLIDPAQDLAASASNSLVDVSAEDIQLIKFQTGATYAEAKNALQDANGDLGEALVELVKSRSRTFTNDSGLGQSGEHGK